MSSYCTRELIYQHIIYQSRYHCVCIFICVFLYVRMRTYVRTYVRACVRACVCLCLRACVCVQRATEILLKQVSNSGKHVLILFFIFLCFSGACKCLPLFIMLYRGTMFNSLTIDCSAHVFVKNSNVIPRIFFFLPLRTNASSPLYLLHIFRFIYLYCLCALRAYVRAWACVHVRACVRVRARECVRVSACA